MWAAYLVFSVLAVVRAAKLQYCQELTLLGGSTLRKDVATMVITIDGTCSSCYQEIQKLVTLRVQMAKLGHNADIMVAINHLPQDYEHGLPSSVTVDIEDVWIKLGQQNGHIFVFDKCGKLAYQVITPWSKQMYPFTAMASLSALYDAPCGECNATSQVLNELNDELRHTHQGVINQSGGSDGTQSQENKLPLTISIPGGHEHILNGKRVTYDLVELKTNDPHYRGHGAAVNVTSIITTNITNVPSNETRTEETTQTADAENGSTVSIRERQSSLSSKEPSKEPSKSQQDYTELLKRYQPLMKWRFCANQVMSIRID